MDKREAVRVSVRVHARCRLDTGVVMNGTVEDVSRSGIFLALEEDPGTLACGSQTFLALEIPGNEPIQLEAEVVRVEETGVGMRFVETSEVARRPLANFIMKQAALRVS
jgi:c-di-GMP-binding flagellar brake protein YcgR